MLCLASYHRWVAWPEAGVRLKLGPLTEEVHARLLAECVTEDKDEYGRLKDLKRDVLRYDEGVGLACVHDWEGVVDEDGAPVPCTPEAVKEAMHIRPFKQFVHDQVAGLNVWIYRERDAAGNA